MAGAAKKKKKGGAGDETPPSPMEMWIGRARGIGAILGFLIAFWVCRRQGFDVADAALRGLVGAVGLSLVAWWSALRVIQALMRSAVVQTNREAEAAALAQARAQAEVRAAAAASAAAAAGETA